MRKRWFRILFARRMIAVFLIILQLAFMAVLIWNGSKESVMISRFLNLMSFLVALYILKDESADAYKITWIFLILLFPIFGGLFFLLIKCQSSTRKFAKHFEKIESKSRELLYLPRKQEQIEFEKEYSLNINYLEKFAGFPVYENTSSEYFTPGEKFFPCFLEQLEKAEKYIFLEYFIVQEGKMFNSILEILEKKAKQGIDVRIIYDDLGCFLLLPKNYKKTLENKGIKCSVFNPFRPVLESVQNNRDHRKIAVIDGKVAFTGGINLADEYINEIEKHGNWKDSAIMLTGDAAWSFTMMFLQMWSFCEGVCEDYKKYYPEKSEVFKTDGFVQPYSDSPMDKENVGEHVYMHIINGAKKYLYINTPYLIIDESLSTSLILAAKSGVDVRIVTPGIWDKRFVHFTTRSYYRELIKAGVRVYEYKKGFMHSKIFVSDDTVATVGTTNLDYRSLYLHFECGVCLYGAETIKDIKDDFLNTLKDCHEIRKDECKGNAFTRFLGEIFRLFAPLM